MGVPPPDASLSLADSLLSLFQSIIFFIEDRLRLSYEAVFIRSVFMGSEAVHDCFVAGTDQCPPSFYRWPSAPLAVNASSAHYKLNDRGKKVRKRKTKTESKRRKKEKNEGR